ncbi:MAG: transporter associated domain-containing protein, partial [Gammaproteobacteria bacterium]|nr:transporter associated domain-containing protein [Gammaproteobacteria bacterium]
ENDTYLIDGSTHIRDINHALNWSLPADGPKTLNGLILEHMEIIPQAGTSLMIEDYTIEILRSTNNVVQTARVQNTRPISKAEDADQQTAPSTNA